MNSHSRRIVFVPLLGCFLAVAAAHGAVVISEFMASNKSTLQDQDGDYSDWIELHNAGTAIVNLAGWHLTDDALNATKWRLPATNIAPGAFLLVFASDKDRAQAGAELHTNFKLSASGEYLALVQPDGTTIACAFAPAFPPQVSDVSYGFSMSSSNVVLVRSNAVCAAFVPRNNALGVTWTSNAPVSETGWLHGQGGVGFERGSGYQTLFGIDVGAPMYASNATCYLRIPFVLEAATQFSAFTVRMMYDDGFVAYVNGRRLADANAPATLAYNSRATTIHADSAAVLFEEFPALQPLTLDGGTNILAVHGLNQMPTSSDFLIVPELIGSIGGDLDTNVAVYFPRPTPGAPNDPGTQRVGPHIGAVGHTPFMPNGGEDIVVTAQVTGTLLPLATVTCVYRVMYGSEVAVPMYDDGAHGDGDAADGIFGARIPAGIATAGQMIRYYILTADTTGACSRLPFFLTPTSEEYYGTVVNDPSINTNIPVFHWFTQNPAAADTRAGARCSLFANGEFYDNMFVRLRGDSSSGRLKKPHEFKFNSEHHFNYRPGRERVDEINLGAMYNDQTYMRDVLAVYTFQLAGLPSADAYHIHLRQNGAFHSLALNFEQLDGKWMRRVGLDDNGRFYKTEGNQMWLREVTTSGYSRYDLKRPKDGDYAPLQQLVDALVTNDTAYRRRFAYDRINLAETINYLACNMLVQDMDLGHKSYYMYYDTYGSGEWSIFPWDKDLSFGHRWAGTNVVATDDGDDGRGLCSPYNGWYNALHGLIFNNGWPYTMTPDLCLMYARRVRTLMDTMLQCTNVPRNDLIYETRIGELLTMLKPLADADRAKWGFPSPPDGFFNYDHLMIDEGVNELTNYYFAPRRWHLFYTHNIARWGILPNAQPDDATVDFGAIELCPTSNNQDEEYIEIRNTNRFALDISGWRISNAVDYVFQPGTVILSNSSLFVTPNALAFRARSVSPKGGQQRFVQGNYNGRLSAWGDTIYIYDNLGRLKAITTPVGNPSLAQRYLRITEIMYHPPKPPPSSPYTADDFEFIEVMNTSTDMALNVTGAAFIDGIAFTMSNTLPAGACGVIVANPAAFATRYDTNGMIILGAYAGALNNAGETIALADHRHETILNFQYSDDWYPETDGQGYSLTIVDPYAARTTWGDSNSWMASEVLYGTPGSLIPEPTLLTFLLIGAMARWCRRH